ncbi:hypothetical protein QUF74_18955, partial [Candidatus Halobeggiatoa sp. HSG11]|nr:hypothetical protein [Candidatus Halobeggiatoa sp. HSG11]
KIENLIKLLIMGQGFSFFIYVCFRLLIKPIMLFFYTFVRLSASTTVAEIVLDGTLGSEVTLSGPNFAIEASLGKLEDNNLFHSFSTFNLDSNETANFLGTSNIRNVISQCYWR